VARELRLYLANVAAALVLATTAVQLGLAWLDTVGYLHFLESFRNL
jgi:hypothetical protein